MEPSHAESAANTASRRRRALLETSRHRLIGREIGREREVLQRVAERHTSRQIAARVHLSTRTVEPHRRRIMEKLDLPTVADLTQYAIREGFVLLDG